VRLALTRRVLSNRSNGVIAAAIVFAILLWGGNNAGTKFLVAHPDAPWPPIWTGGTRFLCAGFLLLGLLRWGRWFGVAHPLNSDLRRRLWWRGGLILAAYIIAFNWALCFTSASHVALYLGTAPVWALLWEGRPVDARGGDATIQCRAAGLGWRVHSCLAVVARIKRQSSRRITGNQLQRDLDVLRPPIPRIYSRSQRS